MSTSIEWQAIELGCNAKKLEQFLLGSRQQLHRSVQKYFRSARFCKERRMLIGKSGYRLEWRKRDKPEEPIDEVNNPQYPVGVAVLTYPASSPEDCKSCGSSKHVKMIKGLKVCVRCANRSEIKPAVAGLAIGRNDLCYCGSGKKFKVCHARPEELALKEGTYWTHGKPKPVQAQGEPEPSNRETGKLHLAVKSTKLWVP
jgi:hypothetical protein